MALPMTTNTIVKPVFFLIQGVYKSRDLMESSKVNFHMKLITLSYDENVKKKKFSDRLSKALKESEKSIQ